MGVKGRRSEDKSGRGSPGADILADLTNFSSYFAKVPSPPQLQQKGVLELMSATGEEIFQLTPS